MGVPPCFIKRFEREYFDERGFAHETEDQLIQLDMRPGEIHYVPSGSKPSSTVEITTTVAVDLAWERNNRPDDPSEETFTRAYGKLKP